MSYRHDDWEVGAVAKLMRAAALAVAVLVTGCGSDSRAGAPASNSTGEHTTSTPTTDPSVISQAFDIGGGRHLFLECNGTGSPTILLEAGDEENTFEWSHVAPKLESQTRTCAYDRAGTGASVAATGCRELDDLLGDLERLLRVAGVKGPYLLAGHSGGGFLMAGFAARHPADVAGLVLVETPKAITILPPEVAADIKCGAPQNIEHRDHVAVEHAVWDARKRIGDFPMTVISYDWGAQAPPVGDERTNVEDQRGWLVLSPNSKQVVITSGHDVPNNEPDLVVREIRAVLAAAQKR
jgi:hypothetical protein